MHRVLLLLLIFAADLPSALRAGAAKVDVTPPPEMLPVIRNGGFLSGTVSEVADPLFARALVLDDGGKAGPLVICVVDSCMMPTPLLDRAKALAAEKTGMNAARMLISATHTHSAPSVMDMCLGTDRDPDYTEFLPGKIAEVIIAAHRAIQPAQAGWSRFDAGDYTQTRRWITAPDAMGSDPFGEKTVRAMMHPGYQNPNYVGESGPEDPWFTLLSVRSEKGEPLAVLGNFSMHYFGGHAALSADYFGQFCKLMESKRGGVAMLSQGTSGDLWRVDYGAPRADSEISILRYSRELAMHAAAAIDAIDHSSEVPLAIAERRLTLRHRTPDGPRLAWAKKMEAERAGAPIKNRPQVYARQAIHLHENPTAEVVLQAARIGGLGITALPNEVYAITGLHLKARSPLPLTMNIELANGATGYIPPPEQHHLGGYTTWPSVTAGLAVDAEPTIIENLLQLLEEVSGSERRTYTEPGGGYVETLQKLRPLQHWRMGDLAGSEAFEPGVAFHLPGVTGEGFTDQNTSRSAVFAGGRMRLKAELGADYSVALWFYNGLRHDARPVTGYFFSRGADGAEGAPGLHLGIGGTHQADAQGKLIAFNGNAAGGLLVGTTPLDTRRWYHCIAVRKGEHLQVYLDGRLEIDAPLAATDGGSDQLFFGGRNDRFANFEGRLDEATLFDRALSAGEVTALRQPIGGVLPVEAPLSPEQSLRRSHVPKGFSLQLVAAEPLVRDPVAVDWAEDGSVWVAEMADYPSGENGARGAVVRLVDEDGDYRPDRREEIVPEVDFPTGVMAWGSGVIVTAAGEIFYAEDSDGDGRAEVRETWFKGFIEGNQQLRVNGLRWGLDGWIHCASGGHHAGFGSKTVIESVRTGQRIQLGSRDFRFHPDGRVEALSGPSQFGRVCDDDGHWFGVQNAYPLWHYVLDDRYLGRNPAVPAPDPRQQLRGQQPAVFAASRQQKRFHGFDHVGRYTSACGIAIYRDQLLFPRLPGQRIAFTCEPFSNLVQRHELHAAGPTFTARRAADGERDFFASEDRWCRPVMARTAPDGSLWVVDMYRYMIEHPQWLPPRGQDELRPHFYTGQGKGRIYRITRTGTDHRWRPPAVDSPNGISRDLALRRGDKVTPPGFDDPAPGRRRLALQQAEHHPELPAGLTALAEDPDAQVRLQAAFSLGAFEVPEAGAALLKIAQNDGADPWFAAAVLSSAMPHAQTLAAASETLSEPLLKGLLQMADAAQPALAEPLIADLLQRRGAARWQILATAPARLRPQQQARAAWMNAELADAERAAAMALSNAEDVTELAKLLGPRHSPTLQRAATSALGRLGAHTALLLHWQTIGPTSRRAIEDALLAKPAGVTQLLDQLEAKTIAVTSLSATTRERLLADKDQAHRQRATGLLASLTETDRAAVLARFEPALKLKGDAAKGRLHFLGRCSACHQLGALGQPFGPDLKAISDRSPAALLTGIIDPSRSIEPRYMAYTANLKTGQSLYGLVATETANSVVMRLPDNSERILKRTNIQSLTSTEKSAMPAGLETGMSEQDMADLLAWLRGELGG